MYVTELLAVYFLSDWKKAFIMWFAEGITKPTAQLKRLYQRNRTGVWTLKSAKLTCAPPLEKLSNNQKKEDLYHSGNNDVVVVVLDNDDDDGWNDNGKYEK